MEQNYTNISALLIGISTAFFGIYALHILLWRKERTRFQTLLGWIMAIWAVWNLKDIVITFQGMYTREVLNWIMLIDGWSALTFTVFISEVVQPGWMTWRKLGFLAIPFAIFTLLYTMAPEQWVIYAYVVFLWCYAWLVVIVGFVKMRHYLSYVRKNFSNIDDIDVSWLKPVFFFVIISQLSWLVISLYASVVSDIVYYVSTILLWLMVLHYSWNFRPIKVEKETELAADTMLMKIIPPILEGELERVVEEEKLYLKRDLTLADIALELKTNRTYVSNYLSHVRQQTFYDYINQLRIEKVSVPLLREHREFTLDYIAAKSGFASISTFRRAFQKQMGMTPRQFIATVSPLSLEFELLDTASNEDMAQ